MYRLLTEIVKIQWLLFKLLKEIQYVQTTNLSSIPHHSKATFFSTGLGAKPLVVLESGRY